VQTRKNSSLRNDLVVANDAVVFDHHLAYVRRNDGRLGIRSRERADRLDGLPLGDDEKLSALSDGSPKNRGADKPWKLADGRERFRLQVLDVRVCGISSGKASPLTRDHRGPSLIS